MFKFESYVKVNGRKEFIRADVMSCLETIELLTMQDPKSLGKAIALFYRQEQTDIEASIKSMQNFLYKKLDDFPHEKGKKIMDFKKDFDAIFTAIYRVYHIDITVEPLHWWKFLMMISDISSEPLLVHRIKIRGTNLNEIKDPQQKAIILKEQNRLRLEKKLTLEERNQKWKGC